MSQVNIEGISIQPTTECTAAQVADALTRSFGGYVMPVNVSAQGYERRFRPENVDPFASYVYFRETRPVAIVLLAPRCWTSRVAAVAVTPEARGSVIAKNPDKAWSIPQIVPEGLAPGFFARCGWELQDTNSLEMVLDLSQRSEDGANG